MQDENLLFEENTAPAGMYKTKIDFLKKSSPCGHVQDENELFESTSGNEVSRQRGFKATRFQGNEVSRQRGFKATRISATATAISRSGFWADSDLRLRLR